MGDMSLREACSIYAVSRTTLAKALENGKVSGVRDETGRWRLDPAELARVYKLRPGVMGQVSRASSDNLGQSEPVSKSHDPDWDNSRQDDLATRLARAEAELITEREKNALLERHLEDVRRMLPAPSLPRRKWWPWGDG